MINFQCSACQQSLEVEDAGAGLTLACPACAAEIVVPGPNGQDTPESVLQSVREQADRKARLQMYYAAADLAREYMGSLAEVTKAEREQLALTYEQQGRQAEANRARPAAVAVVAETVTPSQPAEVKTPVPTRGETAGRRPATLHAGKAMDRPLRVFPKRAESTQNGPGRSEASRSWQGDGGLAEVSPIVQTGWRLLCGYAIVSLIALFVLDSELRARFDQLHQLSTMTPQNIFSLRLELQNPFPTRSTFLELLGWAERGLLALIAVCAIIALAKDHVKHGLMLLAAAALSFGIVYFAAKTVAHNRTQPLIDQANQQIQQFQQSMDGMLRDMPRLIPQFNPPHR